MSDLTQIFSEIYHDSGKESSENYTYLKRRITGLIEDRSGRTAKVLCEIEIDRKSIIEDSASLSHWIGNQWVRIVTRSYRDMRSANFPHTVYLPSDEIIESMIVEACQLLDMS